jgi:hypothetical protein
MIGLLLFACASQEYVLPQAEVFEDDWEGNLSFVSYQGNEEVCSMHYSMVGAQVECEDCIWEAQFALSALSDSCVFSELTTLSFRVSPGNSWLVLEESGWENWGEGVQEEGVWSFVSSYRFFP